MTRLLIAAALIIAAAPALAQAQPMRDPDLDHDGKVTLEEFRKAASGGGIARVDADKDGRISRGEWDGVMRRVAMFGGAEVKARGATMWTSLDADQDGFVTAAEREASQKRRFEAADTNDDGWLSKSELLMMRQNRARGG